MITTHYTLSKDDYVNYYTYMYWDATDRKRKRFRNMIRQAGFFCLFSSILFLSGMYGRMNKISIAVFLLFFAGAFLPMITGRSQMVKQAEAIADDPDNFSIFNETTLTATEGDINLKNSTVDSKINWAAVIKKTETPKYYFLFLNAMQAIIIPKRAFKNIDEQQAFDKILSRNLSLDAELKDDLL
jgi:YcxB-like protein